MNMDEFSTFEELNELVNNRSGVVSVVMSELRDAHDVRKLGKHVVEAISKRLDGLGLGHVPTELPLYQHQCVRVYRKGSPVGEIINSVLILENEDRYEQNEKGDQLLREVSSNHASEIVSKIRELICN